MGKKLGQYFLINKNKIRKIIEALELKDGDVIIEIGPGHGELTKEIQNLKIRIIAIEKDAYLEKFLKEKFKNDKNIKIIEGDALKLLLQLTDDLRKTANKYKIVGNIPYYITGYLLRILGELENKPESIVLMIQKEVAERVVAEPPKMNLLAASVQFWAKPEIIDYVSKKDFFPQPKVDGAIIRFTINNQLQITNNQRPTTNDKYYEFIKIFFKQPRKTILNNLREITNDKRQTINSKQSITNNKLQMIEKLKKLGINPQDRPQNLNFEQIIKLSTLF